MGRPIMFEELSPDEFRREAADSSRPAVDMLPIATANVPPVGPAPRPPASRS